MLRNYLAEFKDAGRIDLTGATVNSIYDLAQLVQIWRNPFLETHPFGDGRILANEALTSRIPGRTAVSTLTDFDEIVKVSDHVSRVWVHRLCTLFTSSLITTRILLLIHRELLLANM